MNNLKQAISMQELKGSRNTSPTKINGQGQLNSHSEQKINKIQNNNDEKMKD